MRATGSGAGCGDSWPKCGQQFVPANPTIETLIEFAHRSSSFLAGLGVAALFFLSLWAWPKRHLVRKAATASAVLIIVEALLGASLVIFGWVKDDISVGRMIVVPLHLANTFALLGALGVTAWWGSGFALPNMKGKKESIRWLLLGLLTLVVVGASGTLNALADAVFPANSLSDGIADEFGPTAPMLLRLRIIHPFVAIAGGLFVAWIAAKIGRGGSQQTQRLAAAVSVIVLSQFFIGIANIFFLTPLSIQVIHLFVADVLWLSFVFFSLSWIGHPLSVTSDDLVSR